ncbi:hypothetical protein [Leptospira yasudae]|uniref:Uncharacterized protein n=1 Tax=Leptospira yasudae TaxID=2202201 RepID=A0ABX9M2Q4_9LEPT|nr:hypothetical protein [Leptospira yasudae]RHX79700.1 hypothetical protein DLM77_12545 [Leptospira yasudae]
MRSKDTKRIIFFGLTGKKTVPVFLNMLVILLSMSFGLFCAEEAVKTDSFTDLFDLIGGNPISQPESKDVSPLILNDLTVQTTDWSCTQGTQKIEVYFSFRNTPPAPTSVKGYLGRPGIMTLSTDGLTVDNFILQESTPNSLFPDRFIFYSPETSQSYKIIVTAFNAFGKSTKEINSVPPNDHCQGTVNTPVTI